MHTSRAVFFGPATYEPWGEIPVAYIICEEDGMLPPPVQEIMVGKMGEDCLTYRLKASHWPFLSIPDEMVGVLVDLVEKS